MSPSSVLKKVKESYPELEELPKAKLKLVEQALVFASRLGSEEGLISDREHAALMSKIAPKGGASPGNSLRAYRIRKDLSQSELARESGIPQSNISAMEAGRRPIGLASAKRLAEILDCDYRKLV